MKFTLIEFLDAIEKSGFKGNLRIITNCCYSAGWVLLANEMWKNGDQRITFLRNIYIESSCDSINPVFFGRYRKLQKAQIESLEFY